MMFVSLAVLTLPLSDDHQPAPAPVLLGQHGQLQSDLSHIGCAEVVHLSVGGSLGLVTEYDVSEGRTEDIWSATSDS